MVYFSASDAQNMQFTEFRPQKKQSRVADQLFDAEDSVNKQPEDIGLSLWRFSVGAGNTRQGKDDQIASPWMRAEYSLGSGGTYNRSKQQGQRNFLKLAKGRGINKSLVFLNSPPVYYTQDGLAINTGYRGATNLKPDCYEECACFLANVVQGIEEHNNVEFNYACPFNRPNGHWNWVGPKQEGRPTTDKEITRTVRLLNKELVDRDVDTRILVNESSDYRYIFRTHETDWQRRYQIQVFFHPDSVDTYLGDTPDIPHLMLGHSYQIITPLSGLRNIHCQLRDILDKHQTGFWQIKTYIMDNDEEINNGNGFGHTMKAALYVTRIIHHDVVYARTES